MTSGGQAQPSWLVRLAKSLTAEDGHFAIDLIKNSFWFCVIGSAALGLEVFIAWLKAQGASDFLQQALTVTKIVLLIGDVVWFASRIVLGAFNAVVRAYSEGRETLIALRQNRRSAR